MLFYKRKEYVTKRTYTDSTNIFIKDLFLMEVRCFVFLEPLTFVKCDQYIQRSLLHLFVNYSNSEMILLCIKCICFVVDEMLFFRGLSQGNCRFKGEENL